MNSRTILQRDDLMEFITHLYDGDLHAKRVLSPANATRAIKGRTSARSTASVIG